MIDEDPNEHATVSVGVARMNVDPVAVWFQFGMPLTPVRRPGVFDTRGEPQSGRLNTETVGT